jgi:hypothetical protein
MPADYHCWVNPHSEWHPGQRDQVVALAARYEKPADLPVQQSEDRQGAWCASTDGPRDEVIE